MKTVETLNHYLRGAERRLRVFALSRGAAVTAIVALAVTIGLAMVADRWAFSPGIVLAARLLLFFAVALALAFAVVIPTLETNRRNAARRVEQKYPEFEQRLLTFAERRDAGDNPFLTLLASETAEVARRVEPGRVAPRRRLIAWLASGAGAAGVLVWLIAAGPGYLGYGASLLWAGPKVGNAALYDIIVSPGDGTVRRRSDQLITAQLVGFDNSQVRLKAKFGAGSKWEEVAMHPQPAGGVYEFLFAALPDSVEYYVESRGVRSKTHKLSVIDLPGVKSFRVTYRYPAWSGMKPATEDPGGDLRAVEGTVAELTVQTDAPLRNGIIALDDDSSIRLNGTGTTLHAEVPIQKDGMYHFAAVDRDRPVRLSEDYFIEARKDSPPQVKLTRPGRDAKVSPIEEVPLAVEAEDDFGLQDVALHYSVNGGAEKTVNITSGKGLKHAEGKTLLALEEFKLVPGDIVAVYATARDARNTSRTDIYFIEAQPFEFQYSQSQQSGGGSGDGEQEGKISARQKEIIAATWNEMKGRASQNASESAENARFLAQVQSKLRDQANSLAERAKSRALAGVNQEFQNFVKGMDEAVKEMSAASAKLKAQGWQDALGPEQRALQHLLRAESVFREIQVAMGRSGGGGSGGAARDLDNLFDLELDTEKNQYETGQQSGSNEQRERDLDETLQKLEQLARRQQELAREQNRRQQTFEQRWEQEQLRREAEELRRRMEQLSRGEPGKSGSASQSASEQSGSQAGQAGRQGSRGQAEGSAQRMRQQMGQQGSDQRLRQAFDRLSQATDDMRQSAGAKDQATAGAQRAAERLEEAKELLRGMRQQQSANQLDDLARRAEELAAGQRDFTTKMRKAFGGSEAGRGNAPGWSETQQLASEKEKLARDLENVERDAQKASRDLAGSQPAASAKLRKGLGEFQQDDVRMRMKFSANWIRRGLGANVATGESVASMAINKLADSIKEARASVGKDGGKPGGGEAERALAEVERLRERAAGAAGQQAGQQKGEEGTGAGPNGSAMPVGVDRTARETVRDLSVLRQRVGPNSEIGREIGDALGEIEHGRPAFGLGGATLTERIDKEILPALEQLEMQLRRRVEGDTATIRNPAAEPVPAGYGERVAEYFRRLSKGGSGARPQ